MVARYDLLQSFVDRFTARVFGKSAHAASPNVGAKRATDGSEFAREAGVSPTAVRADSLRSSGPYTENAGAAKGEVSLAGLARGAAVPSAVSARKPCPALWKTPVIRWDGQVHVCCADLDGKIKVGNIREKSIKELWEGPDVTRYRLLHIEGRFDDMPMCGPCAGFNWYDVTPEEIESYLREVGREDLWPAYRRRMGLA